MTSQRTVIFSEYEDQAWLDANQNAVICDDETFQQCWNAKPDFKHTIMMFGSEIPIPRYQAIWGRDYKFSGKTLERSKDPMPALVQSCIQYATSNSPEFQWNAALVNWYPDGSSYISAHSDDEKDLNAVAPIYSFSFGGVRKFRIRNKANKIVCDIDTKHQSAIRMGGALFQTKFKHEVVKTKKKVAPRINVTVRCFV